MIHISNRITDQPASIRTVFDFVASMEKTRHFLVAGAPVRQRTIRGGSSAALQVHRRRVGIATVALSPPDIHVAKAAVDAQPVAPRTQLRPLFVGRGAVLVLFTDFFHGEIAVHLPERGLGLYRSIER